eukprot:Nk52_evm19s2579 gene=Nk52_evmTU19s2579
MYAMGPGGYLGKFVGDDNYRALFATFAIAVAFLKTCDYIAYKDWLSSKDSRKLIHIGTGPIFLLSWSLFTPMRFHVPFLPGMMQDERCLAALVPLVITFQFALIGLGFVKDEAAVKSMSRNGRPSGILQGPLYYGIVFVAMTLLFWKSLLAIIPLCCLCGGDGFAELVGRRMGTHILRPVSRSKTLEGSAGFVLGAFVVCCILWHVGCEAEGLRAAFPGPLGDHWVSILVVSALSGVVEAVSPSDWDNFTVPAGACLLTYLLVLF